MGAWFSDVRGGQQAVGGSGMNNAGATGGDIINKSDAVDYYLKKKGLQPLYAQIQVYKYMCVLCIYVNLVCPKKKNMTLNLKYG